MRGGLVVVFVVAVLRACALFCASNSFHNAFLVDGEMKQTQQQHG